MVERGGQSVLYRWIDLIGTARAVVHSLIRLLSSGAPCLHRALLSGIFFSKSLVWFRVWDLSQDT